jgi:hypothetical protein
MCWKEQTWFSLLVLLVFCYDLHFKRSSLERDLSAENSIDVFELILLSAGLYSVALGWIESGAGILVVEIEYRVGGVCGVVLLTVEG